MKLPRVHIALGVREDGSCVTLYAGAHGASADLAFRNAPETPGQIGGALLFKFPEPAKRRTFPVTAPVEEPEPLESVEDFAGELYETYCAGVGGVAFNGDQLPSWVEFRADPAKQKQAEAWITVARTALSMPVPMNVKVDAQAPAEEAKEPPTTAATERKEEPPAAASGAEQQAPAANQAAAGKPPRTAGRKQARTDARDPADQL